MKRVLVWLIPALSNVLSMDVACATHLMGGSLTYSYTGQSAGNYNYHVTLKIYRYCTGSTASLDPQALLGIFLQDPANPNADKQWYQTATMPITSQSFITPPSPGINCTFNASVCVEEGIYETGISLPGNAGGYHLIVERCCRNGNIVNLSTPGNIGMSYYTYIPPAPVINSSPQFSDIPVPYICTGDSISIVNNAVDPDGDVLVYSMEIPYIGYSGTTVSIPDPQIDLNPYAMPIPEAIYNPGYSVTQPFGAGGYADVDPVTGLTTYYIPNQGFFVVVIEIKEYRNGQLISVIRRDLQLIAIACPPNNPPNLSATNGSGNTTFNVVEGQTLCFPSIFVDPNGDSLYLTPSGNIFNGAIVNPPASMPTASGNGIVNSVFCWSTECGMAQPAPYQFLVNVIDNGCPPMQTNVIYSINVLPAPPNPTPSVSIAASPAGPICSGTPVTFTATPTFGGTSPQYQWQINGVNVGTNSPVFTSSTLNNGDVVSCMMTSNSVCVSSYVANSNVIVMTVNPFIAPSVSIAASPAGPVCLGTTVTFTATAVNPGPSPVYQWQVNGINTGGNAPVFSSSALTMGSTVSVTLTADANCPAAASNVISMTVFPQVTPVVTITQSPAGAICPGASVTFTASVSNGGSTPVFQWQVNGVNTGGNSNTFTTTTLNNGDNVQVILTSSVTCPNPAQVSSNVIIMTVSPPTTPSVSISANPAGPVCQGSDITFTATPVLGGTSPSYQWKVNGINAGTNSPTFTSSALQNGDAVWVVMTSNSTCITTPTATSNTIVVNIIPNVIPSVSITNNPAFPVCIGSPVTFTAAPVNGGTSPSYQWQINGVNSGPNSAVFTTTMLTNGAQVRVIMTSNAQCKTTPNAISNVITAFITPLITPSVSISSVPAGPVCAGTQVTFSASTVNGGTAPAFQWFVNGNPAGTNSSSFTTSALQNGDSVSVLLTSNEQCLSQSAVTSNIIVMTVNPNLTPAVTIVSSADTICPNEPVQFTATPVNGGTSPVYQWLLNGNSAGTNSPVFLTSSLVNGDVVSVQLISSETCLTVPSALSNPITIHVNPNLTPSVTFTAFPDTVVCDGTPISFQAAWTNGGVAPAFQWYVNGIPVGSDTSVFTSSTLNNGDAVTVVLTSNANCVLPPTDTALTYIVQEDPILTPAIVISANPPGTFCDGMIITYSSVVQNEGNSPAYQWFVNGQNYGIASSAFSTSQLQDGDTLQALLYSSVHCPSVNPVASNLLVIDRLPPLQPLITGTPEICFGKEAFIQVTTTGGTGGPYYYTWNNNLGNGTGYVVSPPATTTYTVTVSDSCSTPRTDSFLLTVFELPVPSFTIKPPQATILNPFFDFIDASYNTVQWLWNFGDGSFSTVQFPQHTYLQAGYYTVQLIATSAEGCVDSLSRELFVEEVTTIYIPNSFSPNTDGLNDEFKPAGHAMPPYEMTIMNRWGNIVFQSESGYMGWNGKIRSTDTDAPAGVYVYRITFEGRLKQKEFTGRLTLVR